MAQNINEQVSSAAGPAAMLRYLAKTIQPKNFAANIGTLAPLTPVTFNTSTGFWTKYANGGSNGTGTIQGFVGPDSVVSHATENVLANVILAGDIHLDDIPIISGYTLAQLKTDIIASLLRSKGFTIQGMRDFY